MPEYMYLYVNIYIFFVYISIYLVGERVMRNINVGREKLLLLLHFSPLSISGCAMRYCIHRVIPPAGWL